MGTIEELGQEYLDNAFKLRVRMEELKLERMDENSKGIVSIQLEKKN